MQLAEHYLRLREELPDCKEGQEIQITLHNLAHMLFCSTRHIKNILKQMSESEWILWIPGRGRGNHSTLIFLVPTEEIVLEVAKQFVAKGDVKTAFERINSVAPSMKEVFTKWLSQHFGHAVETKAKKQIDTFRFAFVRPIGILDPAFVIHRKDLHMLKQIFDTLVRFNGQTKNIEDHIAHYWEVDDSGTQWTFYLRKGVVFHHGRELTAHDVAYTLYRLRDPKTNSPFQWMFEEIVEINVLQEHILQIKLEKSNHLFLHLLCTDQTAIVPQDVCQEMGLRFGHNPIGTGPFLFVQSDDKLFVLESFKPHFKGAPHLDRVEMWVVTEPDFEDMQKYQMSYGHDRQASEKWKEIDRLEIGGMHFTFNLNNEGPQQEKSFRKAIHHALNRTKLIDELGGKRASPSSSFLPYIHDQQYEQSYDPKLAKKLVKESGYSGESLKLYTYEKYYNEQDIVWIKNQCEQIGINLDIKVLPVDELFQKDTLRAADIVLSAETLDDNIEFTMLQLYQTDNSCMKNHLNPELSSLVEEKISLIRCEPLRDKRLKMIKELEQILRDHFFVVFLYHYRQRAVYQPSLKNLSFNSLGWVNFKDLWVKANEG
jgi:SgrR family transcriptional regulator